MRYAVVCDSVVVNIVLWDGETEFEPEEGMSLHEVTDEISLGWTFDNGEWIAPPPPDPPPPTDTTTVDTAKLQALLELTALGVSEATARTIVGLPPEDEPVKIEENSGN